MSDSTQPIPRHPSSPDHRADGRFAPGNSAAAGRGNPHAAKVNAWRNALAEAVSPGDIREAVERLVVEAKSGEGWATSTMIEFMQGQPVLVFFLVLSLGYFVGRIEVAGISLGAAAGE